MNLPNVPASYQPMVWRQILNALAQAVSGAFQKRQDVRLENGERLILKASDGSLWAVKVDGSGNLSTTAV